MGAMSDPRELFLHELQDIYYAESVLAKALPVMAREASDRELATGFRKHLTETKRHVGNLVCDLFLTGAAARAEHYEIAAYSGLVTMARGLGERECVRLLDENLRQEKEALKLAESVGKRLARGAKQMVAA